MAQQQAFQAYNNNNKGTLLPGQTISVNKYNVQVERYLSQGGFAHVYLVRTATPVYNTTHHVLKRIAVSNDAMLTEVKKEVDIMRILKGHPNIVHLIDAAWHRMPNGMYEVFILMEFCPGGGIIDMMNRRLRERLTESEILQIFVDVLEGVAAMHNLRPALLHRDLKVENILQSSPTSFKLCDFGSATPVAPRVPSTNAEIRALEADLNRHTTLQYRAPEMVDPYLRRPVDEKSDVWALGVLLYKLCYYTTPFEEHGPLAILSVQYRIPPYPVYSSQMNNLIASMLREHGAQRPSVFELLPIVHKWRGTKSRFTYNVSPAPPLSPRHAAPLANPLDDLVTFQSSTSPAKNMGTQAREKVLEAIAPMRRGRPTSAIFDTPSPSSKPSFSSKSRPPSPTKDGRKAKNWLDDDFETEYYDTKGAPSSSTMHGQKSGEAWRNRSPAPPSDDAWKMGNGTTQQPEQQKVSTPGGFENDFAEKLWDSFDSRLPPLVSKPSSSPAPQSQLQPKQMITAASNSRLAPKNKDAFEGLAVLSERVPAPTLGEARRLRTGLAAVQMPTNRPPSSRPTPSPRPTSRPASTRPPLQSPNSNDTAIETRFPSLEELDATFASSSPSPSHINTQQTSLHPPRVTSVTGGLSGGSLKPPTSHRQGTYGQDGVRSEQVTGTAMREPKEGSSGHRRAPLESSKASGSNADESDSRTSQSSRPALSRKHRSSLSIKHQDNIDLLSSEPAYIPASSASSAPRLPARPQPLKQQPDWLTGDDVGDAKPPGTPVLRQSPSKRTSYIESGAMVESNVVPAKAQSAVVERQSSPEPAKPIRPSVFAPKPLRPPALVNNPSESVTSSSEKVNENWSPIGVTSSSPLLNEKDTSSSDDVEEGPEDVNGYVPAPKETRRRKGKGRQSSVHDLVDLWGGSVTVKEKEPAKEKERPKEHSRKPSYKSSPTKAKDKSLADILSKTSVSGDPKRRQGMLGSASTTYVPPQPLASSPESSAPQTRSPNAPLSGHRKQMSTIAPAPISPSLSSGRSPRPQSMFIFPAAKSNPEAIPTDGLPSLSAGLVPHLDNKPRAARRTSISDMVQRFEAIGTSKAPIQSPTTAPKPGLKAAAQATNATNVVNGRTSAGSSSPVVAKNTGRSVPVANEHTGGDPSKYRRSPTRPSRISLTSRGDSSAISATPSKVHRTQAPSDEIKTRVDYFGTTFPMSKSATSPDEQTQPPPSPERPYQGVGKLIDQWQRKSAESDPPRGPIVSKRSGYVAKRVGAVGGDGNK